MEKYALKHLEELYLRALHNGAAFASPFYSEEEISEALAFLKGEFGKGLSNELIHLFGGHESADRQRIVFSSEEVDEHSYIGAMLIESNNRIFLGFEHREVLGALMGLGIKRGLLGDILISDSKTYLFYAKEAEETILSLDKVAKENVKLTSILLEDVPNIATTEKSCFPLPSLRLDTLIAHVYHLSREQAKEAIKDGLVKVSQIEMTKNDYIPKQGERISLKGKGKFRYIGENGYSKKGKPIVEIEIYR